MFTILAAQVLVWMTKLEPVAGHKPADVAAWPALAKEIADSATLWPLKPSPARKLDPTRYTAALMVVYAWHESRFRWTPCTKRWNCDRNGSAGAFQTAKSWGSPGGALTVDLMHESWARCGELDDTFKLAGYAYGPDCDHRHDIVALRDASAERLHRMPVITTW
jgi:hypothetical protein